MRRTHAPSARRENITGTRPFISSLSTWSLSPLILSCLPTGVLRTSGLPSKVKNSTSYCFYNYC